MLPVAASLAASCATEPLVSIDGVWAGREIPFHTRYIILDLERRDGRFRGTACLHDGFFVVFKNVPVTGDGYRVRAETPAGRLEVAVQSTNLLRAHFVRPRLPVSLSYIQRIDEMPSLCR